MQLKKKMSYLLIILSLFSKPILVSANSDIENIVLKDVFHIYYEIEEDTTILLDKNNYKEGDKAKILSSQNKNIIGWTSIENSSKIEYYFNEEIEINNYDLVLYPIYESNEKKFSYKNSFDLMSSNKINIDGNFDDWNDLPYSYEYNWDNSNACWYWGVWIGNDCYKTPEGTYSTDVRHKMQLYCDGEYVYLHIVFSRNYNSTANGNDYQFYINGIETDFQVEYEDRTTLANTQKEIGIYKLFISHRNTGLSYQEVIGSLGYYRINNNENINNELELKIPLIEMVKQNSNVNLDTISTIEFFSPNLMYRHISSVGTSTYPIVLGIFCSFLVISIIIIKKR